MNDIEYNNNGFNNNGFNNNGFYNDNDNNDIFSDISFDDSMIAEDTNFYALPVSKNQYFAIDIGTEDVIDVDSQKSKFFKNLIVLY